MNLFNEDKKRLVEQQVGLPEGKHWMENRVVEMSGEKGVSWQTEWRITVLVLFPVGPRPVSTRWTPLISPLPTPTLAFQALIFHMISLPPVLRLALALRAMRVTAPFSTGKIFTETCFIGVDLIERKSLKLCRDYV